MMDEIDEERESLYELISVGAIRAAHALSTILGHEIAAGSPSVKQIDQDWADGNWGTGVIFEVDGEVSGLVAILLPTISRKVLGALMVGKDSPRGQEAATRSALAAALSLTVFAAELLRWLVIHAPNLLQTLCWPMCRRDRSAEARQHGAQRHKPNRPGRRSGAKRSRLR